MNKYTITIEDIKSHVACINNELHNIKMANKQRLSAYGFGREDVALEILRFINHSSEGHDNPDPPKKEK